MTDDRPQADSVRSTAHEMYWATWSVVAAFGTYFSMYAFRKPFTAAGFEGSEVGDLSFKAFLVIAQTFGYMASKFIGIKVVSEMPPERRAWAILVLLGIAEVALVLFGLTPRPWNAFFLFCNGLPLGMVFGLVLGFLEGRRLTEALMAGLCASFILAGGVMKSLGTWLLEQNVPEDWMPAVAGFVFIVPLLIFVLMLRRIPPPSAHDELERTIREPMTSKERSKLFGRYGIGLSALVVVFLLVTILRSVRDDFAPEIWKSLGYEPRAETFTLSESLVAFGVLIVNGALVLVRNSRLAFYGSLLLSVAGIGLLAAAVWGQRAHAVSPFAFMVIVGLGLYVPYIAFHTTVFERFLAMTRERGNLGFLMQVADFVGYLGYVGVLLVKSFFTLDGDFIGFFMTLTTATVVVSIVCLFFSWRYFTVRSAPTTPVEMAAG